MPLFIKIIFYSILKAISMFLIEAKLSLSIIEVMVESIIIHNSKLKTKTFNLKKWILTKITLKFQIIAMTITMENQPNPSIKPNIIMATLPNITLTISVLCIKEIVIIVLIIFITITITTNSSNFKELTSLFRINCKKIMTYFCLIILKR